MTLIMRRQRSRVVPFLLSGLILAAGVVIAPEGLAPSRASAAGSEVAVTIVMSEFVFQPRIVQLAAGRSARLRLINRGQIAHQFESAVLTGVHVAVVGREMRVEGRDVDVVRLQPGAAATVTFVARRTGRVPFVCTIEGHREAGMSGILDVR